MRIHVLVPSRGREQSLQAVLVSLFSLSSGVNDVEYTVICDDDDISTRSTAMTLRGLDVSVKCGPRRLIHKTENEIVTKSEADVFMPWADDLFCVTPHWDEMLRKVVEQVPAFSWQEVQDPKNHTAIVLEKKWVQAVGRFYPEHFPFWFADTWMKEVFAFVYGEDMPIVQPLRFSHKREPTLNMHDLEFWFKVFAATRYERIQESKKVCAAYGRTWVARPEFVTLFEKQDQMQLERVPQYELAFGANQKEPSQMYLEAKAKAERFLTLEHAFSEAA
jgi:hypothetical protein